MADLAAGWSHQQGVDYEIAQDTLTQLIAHAGRRITQLQAHPAVNAADNGPGNAAGAEELATWQARLDEWTRRRLELTPTDAEALRVVLTTDTATLQALQAGDR